jgi:hypothetical protein
MIVRVRLEEIIAERESTSPVTTATQLITGISSPRWRRRGASGVDGCTRRFSPAAWAMKKSSPTPAAQPHGRPNESRRAKRLRPAWHVRSEESPRPAEALKAVTAVGKIGVGPSALLGRKILSGQREVRKVQASTWPKEEDRIRRIALPEQRRRIGVRCEGGHPSQPGPSHAPASVRKVERIGGERNLPHRLRQPPGQFYAHAPEMKYSGETGRSDRARPAGSKFPWPEEVV